MADLVIGCHERNLAYVLELCTDLKVQRILVGLHRQQEVGPPAPAFVEKRFLGVERVSLDENTHKIQLAEQLHQNCTLLVFACGVAGLADRHPRAG